MRAGGQVDTLQEALGAKPKPGAAASAAAPPTQSTPGRPYAQTPLRTPWTTATPGGTPGASGGRRAGRMQLLSASGRKTRDGQSSTGGTPMRTPDASPIGGKAAWRTAVAPSPLAALNSSARDFAGPGPRSSPAIKGSSAAHYGKASQVFAASPFGPGVSPATSAGGAGDAVSEQLRNETRAVLASVQKLLEEQRAACKAIGYEARRLQ